MSDEANSENIMLGRAGVSALSARIHAATQFAQNLTLMEKELHQRQNALSELMRQHLYERTAISRKEFVDLVHTECERLKWLEMPTGNASETESYQKIRAYYEQITDTHNPNRTYLDYIVYLHEESGLDLAAKDFPMQYAKAQTKLKKNYLDAVEAGNRKDNLGNTVSVKDAFAQIQAFQKVVIIDALHSHEKWLINCFDAVREEFPKPQVQGFGALIEANMPPPTLCVSKPFVRELEALKRKDAPTPQADTKFYREMQQWRNTMLETIEDGIKSERTVTKDRLDGVLLDARVQAMSSILAVADKETVEDLIEIEKKTALKSPFAMFLREQGLLGISGQRLDLELYLRQHDALQEKFKYWLIVNPGAEEGVEQKPEDAVFAIPADERYEFYCNQFDRYAKMVDIVAVTEQVQEQFVANEKLAQNAERRG
jgi:hypothetical protein